MSELPLPLTQTTLLATPKQWREAWTANWNDPNLVRVKVAVAYCSRNGVAEIKRVQHPNRVPLQLLVGLNDGVTDVFAREALFDWSQKQSEVEIHGEFQSRGRFHPKVYIFESKDEVRVLAGSVNLTQSAFFENTEAALEWVLPSDSPDAEAILSTFQSWWEGAPSLERPGQVASDVAHLGIEDRLIATMKEGVLVEIEALLSTAHGYFESDVFDLGHSMRVKEGTLLVERSRQTQIFLLSQGTHQKLLQYREEAHKNCRSLSFSCAAGHFVPVTALSEWKKNHTRVDRHFRDLLQTFLTSQGREAEKTQLQRELPNVVGKVWRGFHKTTDVPKANLQTIIQSTLKQFDQRSADFPISVRLSLSLAQHPFSSMRAYAQTSSIVEVELHEFAVQNREQILRDWMTTLLSTTRQLIVLNLDQLLDGQRKSDTHARLRLNLSEQLVRLNFYGDRFCQHVASTLISLQRKDHERKAFRDAASADLLAVQEWPSLTLDEVLQDFASRVGWLSSSSN